LPRAPKKPVKVRGETKVGAKGFEKRSNTSHGTSGNKALSMV